MTPRATRRITTSMSSWRTMRNPVSSSINTDGWCSSHSSWPRARPGPSLAASRRTEGSLIRLAATIWTEIFFRLLSMPTWCCTSQWILHQSGSSRTMAWNFAYPSDPLSWLEDLLWDSAKSSLLFTSGISVTSSVPALKHSSRIRYPNWHQIGSETKSAVSRPLLVLFQHLLESLLARYWLS